MGYTPPVQTPAIDDGTDADDGRPPAWVGSMGGVPVSDAVRSATTAEAALKAFERQFFGEVKDVSEL